MARLGTALERRSADAGRGPVAERLVAAVERGLTRALERRVGGGSSDRRPGRLEQRLVVALERRLAARAPQPTATRAWVRVGRALAGRPSGGKLASGPQRTLRALVVSILARAMVRTLLRFAKLLSRGIFSRPMRRLLALLARRAIRAGPTNQLGIMGLLAAGLLLAYRALIRRLSGMPEARQTAIKLGVRGLRWALALLGRLVARLLAALVGRLGREIRRVRTSRST